MGGLDEHPRWCITRLLAAVPERDLRLKRLASRAREPSCKPTNLSEHSLQRGGNSPVVRPQLVHDLLHGVEVHDLRRLWLPLLQLLRRRLLLPARAALQRRRLLLLLLTWLRLAGLLPLRRLRPPA